MATQAISEKSLTILNFLRNHKDENYTAADIAEALGMEKKSVDGIVTAGLQRKNLTERVAAEIELPGGTHQPIKLIKVTAEGMAYDHEAAVAADIAAKIKSSEE